MDDFRTLIITAADATKAREIAAAFGSGGVGMWTTPLSKSGSLPVTHYISTGYIPAEFVSLAPYSEWETDGNGVWISTAAYPGDSAAVASYAAQAGVKVTKADVDGIFLRADVSRQEPYPAMSRLNLAIIDPEPVVVTGVVT